MRQSGEPCNTLSAILFFKFSALFTLTRDFLRQVLEPPAEYLEEDLLSDERIPRDALYMLQSIRVFGHFDKPIFLKLCKHTEILNIPAGSYLFKIGK